MGSPSSQLSLVELKGNVIPTLNPVIEISPNSDSSSLVPDSGAPPEPSMPWLLRFFKSDFFSVWIAVAYLHRYTEQGVQDYICNELFRFPISEVEFYLPQLLNLYLHRDDEALSMQRYIVFQCCRNFQFALLTLWSLKATLQDEIGCKVSEKCLELREKISNSCSMLHGGNSYFSCALSDDNLYLSRSQSSCPTELKRPSVSSHLFQSPSSSSSMNGSSSTCPADSKSLHLPSQRISKSFSSPDLPKLGIEPNEHGNSSACTLKSVLSIQFKFIDSLLSIGQRLLNLSSSDSRASQLYAELSRLNLNLPARVCIPLFESLENSHHVVRIPPDEAVTLNSKEHCPFVIQIEVVDCEHPLFSPLPFKIAKKYKRDSRDQQPFITFQKPIHSRMSSYDDEIFTPRVVLGSPANGSLEYFHPLDVRRRLEMNLKNDANQLPTFREDPSAAVFRELWARKAQRIRVESPYGNLPGWRLLSVIVKHGDDLRQELFASQLIHQFKKIWESEHLKLWLYPYRILVTSNRNGLIETITDTISLHSLKKTTRMPLRQYFITEFGSDKSELFLSAQRNFVESLAAYSLICYFLQVKDRHNGNILLCGDGHIVHIDFGFMLSNSPKNLGFETAPFKLNQEFVDVMGGLESDMYQYFQILLLQGFLVARKHVDEIVLLVEMLVKNSRLPCFSGGEFVVSHFRDRFQRHLTDDQVMEFIKNLIHASLDNLSTKLYDNFQYFTNGIL